MNKSLMLMLCMVMSCLDMRAALLEMGTRCLIVGWLSVFCRTERRNNVNALHCPVTSNMKASSTGE